MKKCYLFLLLSALCLLTLSLQAQIGPVPEPTSFYISRVKDINPGSAFSSPSQLTDVNGTLFFSANNGINGFELWKSDGSEAGTLLVKNIHTNGDALPQGLINYNGTLFFSAADATNGRELWKSDGTSAGTVLVKNINPSGDSNPRSLVVMNNVLYFTADDGSNGRELWRSDGTSAGTWRVKNLNGSMNGLSDYYKLLVVMGNYLYFNAQDGGTSALWRSDGTANGTSLLYSLTVNTVSYGTQTLYPEIMGIAGGQLFFCYSYWDDVNLPQKSILYKSNGSPGGASLVKSLTHGLRPIFEEVAVLNGTIFFQMNTPLVGNSGSPYEIWKSNGTSAGTVRVKDTNPYDDDGVYNLKTFGSSVFFGARNSNGETCLWKTDGTSANTVIVKELFIGFLSEAKGKLFFPGNGQPWRSDGTENGTRLLKKLNPDDMAVAPGTRFVEVGSRIFFTALENEAYGHELYKYVPCTACPVGSGREAATSEESVAGLQLRVLENPVRELLTVDISGTDGQPLSLHLTDTQGRILETRQLEATLDTQRQVFRIDNRQTESLLLRAVSGQQSQTVKIVKSN